LGVRNAVINNFNPLSLRNDVGQIWENFLIMERVKKDMVNRRFTNRYFWRTWDKQEVDLVEEEGGSFQAVEIKWNKAKRFPPKAWRENYPNSRWMGVDKSNYWEFINRRI